MVYELVFIQSTVTCMRFIKKTIHIASTEVFGWALATYNGVKTKQFQQYVRGFFTCN